MSSAFGQGRSQVRQFRRPTEPDPITFLYVSNPHCLLENHNHHLQWCLLSAASPHLPTIQTAAIHPSLQHHSLPLNQDANPLENLQKLHRQHRLSAPTRTHLHRQHRLSVSTRTHQHHLSVSTHTHQHRPSVSTHTHPRRETAKDHLVHNQQAEVLTLNRIHNHPWRQTRHHQQLPTQRCLQR